MPTRLREDRSWTAKDEALEDAVDFATSSSVDRKPSSSEDGKGEEEKSEVLELKYVEYRQDIDTPSKFSADEAWADGDR